MLTGERDDQYNRAVELSRKADYVQIVRAAQYTVVGGFVGAAIGLGLHVLIPETVIGVVVGAIVGWKDAATRAYLLRVEADRLLNFCSIKDRTAPRDRPKISYLNAMTGRRRNSS